MDNMLKITNDRENCTSDQRLLNDMLPDEADSKVNRCAKNAYDIWEETAEKKSTQLIFCDLSTPKNDGTFNVYDDIREKLVEKGIPRGRKLHLSMKRAQKQKSGIVCKGTCRTGAYPAWFHAEIRSRDEYTGQAYCPASFRLPLETFGSGTAGGTYPSSG